MRLLWLALILACLGYAPAQAQQLVPATTQTVAVAGTVAAATKIISGVTGRNLYITSMSLVPVATSVVTLTAGTGTNCATNTVNLTGAMTFAAGQTFMLGDGYGAIIAAPLGNDICITIATAASPGTISYAVYP